MSHPTRVRGLKPRLAMARSAVLVVAPHAGAWIETVNFVALGANLGVAPHAGAWIETRVPPRPPHQPQCRTPRGCVD